MTTYKEIRLDRNHSLYTDIINMPLIFGFDDLNIDHELYAEYIRFYLSDTYNINISSILSYRNPQIIYSYDDPLRNHEFIFIFTDEDSYLKWMMLE